MFFDLLQNSSLGTFPADPLPLLGSTRGHLYLSPHPLLSGVVAHYTITISPTVLLPTAPPSLALIPDASGCMIFTPLQGTLEAMLWGPTTKMVWVESDKPGSPSMLFVEFLPGGLSRLTGISQDILRDQQFSLEDVLPSLWRSLRQPLEEAKTTADAIALLDSALLACLQREFYPPVLLSAVTKLRQSGGLLPVEKLAAEEHYSQRQLTRLFHRHIGMGAKTFARLVRINGAARQMHLCREGQLTRLGAEAGYYDQAHFIRDFQAICGVSPGGYQHNLSNFYNEPFKFCENMGTSNTRKDEQNG